MNETVIIGPCPSCGAARQMDGRFCGMCGAASVVLPHQPAASAHTETSAPSVLPGLARLLLLLAVTLAGLVVWGALLGDDMPGFRTVLDFKITLSTLVLILAILQPITAAAFYGWLRLPVISADAAAFVHRWSGRVIVVAGAIVAFYCIRDIGPQSSPTRVALHSALGSAVFIVLAAKVIILRGMPRLHPLLPALGFGLSLLFAGLWATSAFYVLRTRAEGYSDATVRVTAAIASDAQVVGRLESAEVRVHAGRTIHPQMAAARIVVEDK